MQSIIFVLALVALATARTDLSGCVSSETVVGGGASYIWYVPGSGEICAFLDCGGGRAPPKTTVPGCLLYSGTATYSPSYLPGYQDGSIAASTTSVAATTTSQSSAMITSGHTTAAVSRQTQPVFSSSVVSTAVSQQTQSVVSSSDVSSSSTSAVILTSTTGIASGSQSIRSSSTQSSSRSSTSSSSAPVSSATGKSGAVMTNNYFLHGVFGLIAVEFACLL